MAVSRDLFQRNILIVMVVNKGQAFLNTQILFRADLFFRDLRPFHQFQNKLIHQQQHFIFIKRIFLFRGLRAHFLGYVHQRPVLNQYRC